MNARSAWGRISILLLVCVCFAIPRLYELDRFVVIDEPRWMARSANFANALAQREFRYTQQSLHPGVTVMWAGAAGFFYAYPPYVEEHPGQLEGLRSVEPYLRTQGQDPIDILKAGRTFVVLIIVGMMVLACWIAGRTVGWLTACVGFLFIAFDPFHVALSRLLHLDGLQASFMLLSVLALLGFLLGGKSRFLLVLSGAAAGLSWLTRSPAFFLIPFAFGLLVIFGVLEHPQTLKRSLKSQGKNFAIWLCAGVICFYLLWPAMWFHPLSTLSNMIGGALSSAGEGHDNPIFFAGSVIQGDPGWSFYPVSYLWRSTPVTLMGLVLAVFIPFSAQRSPSRRKRNWVWFSLALMAVSYMLFLSLSSKKFDRYLLPSLLAFDFIAAMGWVNLLRSVPRWVARGRTVHEAALTRYFPLIGMALLVSAQAVGALRTRPYYFNSFNAALGGAGEARNVLMYGWGEGMDQAARYLNQKTEAQNLRVLAWYGSGPFDYFFQGTTNTLPFEPISLDRITDYDYVIIYGHQWQRELPSREWLSYFPQSEAEHVVYLQDLPYVWIYDVEQLRFQD